MIREYGRWAAAAGIALAAFAAGAQDSRSYSAVTDARLESPEAAQLAHVSAPVQLAGATARSSEINTRNVADLAPVWTMSTGTTEGHQAPPIVNDGVMFVTTPFNQVLAIEAATGDLLWRYRHQMPADIRMGHPTNRGVALYGDRVYTATSDARVVALDAQDRRRRLEQSRRGLQRRLLHDDRAARRARPQSWSACRAASAAFAASSSRSTRARRAGLENLHGPAPGEPGNDTWPGDSWRRAARRSWVTGSFDPALGLTYWGTGNPGPWTGDARPGDNLYTNSVIALDVETGALKGYHQYHWNDSWDWDEVSAPLLVDLPRNGRMVPGLVHPGRNGYLWMLERSATGISFIDAKPYVKQNVFTSIDP